MESTNLIQSKWLFQKKYYLKNPKYKKEYDHYSYSYLIIIIIHYY